MNNETFLRFLTAFWMSVLMLFITISGYLIDFEYYATNIVTLHKTVAGVFLPLLVIHLYLKKKKFHKLYCEFLDAFQGKIKDESLQHSKLIKQLNQRNFQELCEVFELELSHGLDILEHKKIFVGNVNHSLESIASFNNNDPLKIVALLVESRIRAKENNKLK